jgi:hypothetical protein
LLPVLPNIRAGDVKIFAAAPPGRLAVPLVRSFMTAMKQELRDARFAK